MFLQGLLLNFTPSGANLKHNQRAGCSDLTFYSSHEVTWPYPHQWLLLVMSISVTTLKTIRKTLSQFSIKRCKLLITSLSSSNHLHFKYKIKEPDIFFPFQNFICYSLKAQFDPQKIEAHWINLEL